MSNKFHAKLTNEAVKIIKLTEAVARNVLQSRRSSKLRNIHRKTSVFESLFNRVAGLKACNFIKNRLQHMCFPVNTKKLLRTAFLIEHLRWLLRT